MQHPCMKLALHRSVTFWSGIVVMACIAWGWWDSMGHRSMVSCGPWRLGGSQKFGGFSLEGSTGVHGEPPPVSRDFEVKRNTIEYGATNRMVVMPPPAFYRGGGQNMRPDFWADYGDPAKKRSFLEQQALQMPFRRVENWFLFIPYWLVLLVVAPVWFALLLWRARRRKAGSPPSA